MRWLVRPNSLWVKEEKPFRRRLAGDVREIAQATPSHSPKAHIQLDAEQTTSVTIPLTPFRSLELEFYAFGGKVTLPELKDKIRNPGCTKRLVLIEPTPEGHFESPVVGRE